MQKDIKIFKKIVWQYHKNHRRDFVWRETSNPYYILVSEIMLQQTQASRVIPKYNEFIFKFPTLEKLADAPLREVLQIWQGLGYNRRAKYLHECAKQIVENFGGIFPKDLKTLVSLPSIGQSTAGAIRNFAFNIPTPFIETNIRTVFIHHFFNDKNTRTRKKVSDNELMKLITETLEKRNVREWFYALYDYGSFLKGTLQIDPAKQSAQYKKQSTFKGSFREKRAFVLKILLNKALFKTDISKHLVKQGLLITSDKDSIVDQILNSLIKDKLISKRTKGQKDVYFI